MSAPKQLEILPDLYASEINIRLEWFWDGGYEVSIGDEMNGWKAKANFDEWPDALEWFETTAISLYPESDFALARVA